jgi:hypothetical protein
VSENEATRRYYARIQQEYAEFDNPLVKGQMALDRWWQSRLDARARARRSEIPERGEYDPMRRFVEEMDDRKRKPTAPRLGECGDQILAMPD